MNASVGNPDHGAPTQPGALTPSAGVNSVNLSWTASSDNVGVTRYNVHRSTTARLHAESGQLDRDAGERPATSTPGLSPGTYYYRVTAQDAAGNVSPSSNEAAATVTGDITAPSAPTSLVATGSLSSVALSWVASTDNVGVTRYNVHRSTSPGFTPAAGNRIAQPTGDELLGHRPRRWHVLLRRHRRGRGGQPLPAFDRSERGRDGRHRGALAPATLNATGGVSNVG